MRSLGVGRCLTARLTVFLLTWAAAHNPSEAASHWQNVLMGLTTPNPVGIRAHVAHPFRFAALRYRSVSPLRTKKSCFKLTHQVRKVLTVLPTVFLLAAFLASVWTTGSLQASVPRYSVDMQNSRRISDNLEETEFPFQKLWQTDLEG
ncbi:MAG: hypothetical protein FWH28_05370, partial [Clostridiales bacterium]|nr:hypothetical protein [Clostridiales bacterium]